MSRLKDYLALVKFKYHTSFLAIVAITLFFAGVSAELVQKLIVLYLSFNLLLYTGLYTLNDLADLKQDRKHPLKRNRPIASGRVPVRTALPLSAMLIAVGMFTGWLFFGSLIALFYGAFIALNFFYSFIAKHIPYVEIAMNSITHPLRAAMAFAIISQPIPITLLMAYFFFILGIMTTRRIVEKDVRGWEVRHALHHYRTGVLFAIEIASFLMVAALAAVDARSNWAFYALMLPIYVIIVFGMHYIGSIRSLLRSMLTN